MSFEQPWPLRSQSTSQRKAFWERKRCLMSDSLVLVLDTSLPAQGFLAVGKVAKREDKDLGGQRPKIGVACSMQGLDDFARLLSWMRARRVDERGEGERSTLVMLQTQSPYVSCAPILRALQGMAREGGPLPLHASILPTADGSAATTSPPYLMQRYAPHFSAVLEGWGKSWSHRRLMYVCQSGRWTCRAWSACPTCPA